MRKWIAQFLRRFGEGLVRWPPFVVASYIGYASFDYPSLLGWSLGLAIGIALIYFWLLIRWHPRRPIPRDELAIWRAIARGLIVSLFLIIFVFMAYFQAREGAASGKSTNVVWSFALLLVALSVLFAVADPPNDQDPKKDRIRRDWKLNGLTNRLRGDGARASVEICRRLIHETPFAQADRVLAYFPSEDEVDVREYLQHLLDEQRTVCLLRIDWDAKTMTPAVVKSLDGLITRQHGILEPPDDAPTLPVEELDLILVPGVAFDEDCNRLGRGGGFYDRFLATVPPLVKTCGVAFEAQMVRSVPTDSHDRPVDAVVTESRLILRIR